MSAEDEHPEPEDPEASKPAAVEKTPASVYVRGLSAIELAGLGNFRQRLNKQINSQLNLPARLLAERVRKQLASIDTGRLNLPNITQQQIALVSQRLNTRLDLGQNQAVARVVKQWGEQQTNWLKSLRPSLEALDRAIYPPNLRGLQDVGFSTVQAVVMIDGIPLYGVPRRSTARLILTAETLSARRNILGSRWRGITEDCSLALAAISRPELDQYASAAAAAVTAMREGHTFAAQALAGSVVDAIVSEYFGTKKNNYTPNKRGTRTNDAYKELVIRQFLAFAPMWQAYQQFWVTEGDKVPHVFNRNATAHTVSPRQYNRRNAIQAIMFATGLVLRLDEELDIVSTRRQRAAK